MAMEIRYLDCILVPIGLLIMTVYHLWLLHRVIKYPIKTIIGINAISRRFWVHCMMEDVQGNGVLAVQTLRNNIMASTVLASTAITLSSLIALLMTSNAGEKSAIDVGDLSHRVFSIKYFAMLLCFMVVFLLNIQSIRYYSHASILVCIPPKKKSTENQFRHCLTADYVATIVNRGSYFWSLGLRGFYFSLPLFLWIFGPIPMILCCLVLVFLLYFLDNNVEFGSPVVEISDDNHGGSEDDTEVGVVYPIG
ncbi:hypothetical protein E1A91_D02G013300v1 [Gossypium mustelinum]|uniref:DUF599 domain-containing protein n=2 Tax=Gossypium TaxID=3633 RepID=A0A5D2VQE5_GOSMU|nr:uncharacterized protein LOC105796358 [Gossypium raimondii]TYI91713.1 hypothetical protein E1A91_D02G013300v1 [Gossypium mustelinum]